MQIDIKEYLINYIGDTSWAGETNHDKQSTHNLVKLNEVMCFMSDIFEELIDKLYEHKNYRKGNASAEELNRLANHIANNFDLGWDSTEENKEEK